MISQSCRTMAGIVAASARSIVRMVAAAVSGRPSRTSIAYTTPAETLTIPPKSPDTAPCQPAHQLPPPATAALASNCQTATRPAGYEGGDRIDAGRDTG